MSSVWRNFAMSVTERSHFRALTRAHDFNHRSAFPASLDSTTMEH